jgi:hypothetical protein
MKKSKSTKIELQGTAIGIISQITQVIFPYRHAEGEERKVLDFGLGQEAQHSRVSKNLGIHLQPGL